MGGSKEDFLGRCKLRNTFCDELFENILRSISFASDLECDIQVFVDENPKAVKLSELPKAPFLKAIQIYCVSRNFRHPQVYVPLRNESRHPLGDGRISYNNLFRALAVTFYFLPAFKGEKPNSVCEIPTLGDKKAQILRLGVALIRTQEECRGKVNGVVLRGIDFLSELAIIYGIHLTFNDPNEGGMGKNETKPKVKARMFRKFERFHRDGEVIVPFLRRYVSASHDLSSFLLEREWALISEENPKRMTVREPLSEIIKNCSSGDWFSLYKEILLRED